jgi:hypothetical protein
MDWSPFLNIGYICKSKVLTWHISWHHNLQPLWLPDLQSSVDEEAKCTAVSRRCLKDCCEHCGAPIFVKQFKIKLNWQILIRTELDLQTNVICVWYCLWIQVIPRGWLQVSGHWNTKCAGRPCWSAEQKVAAPPTLQIATFKSWHFFAFGFIRLSEGKTLENP